MRSVGQERPSTCFLCGASGLRVVRYLRANSDNWKRNAAYRLPSLAAQTLSTVSTRFSKLYHPVFVNKKYFSRWAVFCPTCSTGSCQPFFSREELGAYYGEFYWSNRDVADGQHIAQDGRPNDRQVALARDRIAWVQKHAGPTTSIVDFGAGDCAAAFVFRHEFGAGLVHVVDPSQHTQELARSYGLSATAELSPAPVVDLVYSAHSIEHVHDLRVAVEEILDRVRPGGYVFFETPNIGDDELFEKLPHTPHTFMLSRRTFELMESIFPVRIAAMEVVGPLWRRNRSWIRSDEKTDLRVLMQKRAEH